MLDFFSKKVYNRATKDIERNCWIFDKKITFKLYRRREMAKKGGKGGEQPQAPKIDITLRKGFEEKAWKGKRISLVAIIRENGKPAANKVVSFFCQEEHVGDEETDAEGKAFHTHLLKKGGDHKMTATCGSARSNTVSIQMIKKKQESVVIRARPLHKCGAEHFVSFIVFSNGTPLEGAILRVQSCAGSFALKPTNAAGETFALITIPEDARDLVCIIKHEGSTASTWQNYFK